MSVGYIKLHRSLLDWQYWDDHNTTRLLIFFLVSVNYEPKKWLGIDIKPGSMICSYDTISSKTSLSIKQIRRSIKVLVDDKQITQETTNRFQLITLVKWEELQLENKEEGRQRAGKGQAKGRQRATTKEDKEIKNNNNIPNSVEKIDWDMLIVVFNKIFGTKVRLINEDTKRKFNARIKTGWTKDEIKNAMLVVQKDKFHIDNNFKYVTLEYFSRDKTLQLYANKNANELARDNQPKVID